MRRASVGEIRDGSLSPTIFHDCSTTQGNSGSPVFLLTTGEVAGIHRSGYFMYRNEAVAASELRALA
jgi:V8-like Glu-specific endopeptidase